MRTDKAAFFFLASCSFLLAACATNEMPEPSEGEDLFRANCASCHGYSAEGNVILADGQVSPDLTRLSARNGGTFPRAEVMSQIDGYGKGKLSPEAMPEFGSILEGDLVPVDVDGTLTPPPRPLAALMYYLESIQKP